MREWHVVHVDEVLWVDELALVEQTRPIEWWLATAYGRQRGVPPSYGPRCVIAQLRHNSGGESVDGLIQHTSGEEACPGPIRVHCRVAIVTE